MSKNHNKYKGQSKMFEMKFQYILLFFLCAFNLQASKKPNILWITIEDTSPQFIGCYGNEDARTPVIDGLASEGVLFKNVFSTGTVCSPSRTAIITGVKTYKTGTGNHKEKYKLPDYLKGFPYYLRQAGYYTTNNKKTDYNIYDEKSFIEEAWNESSGEAGWWNRKNGQPFFSVFNFMDSHQSRTMTYSYDWYKENVLNYIPSDERIHECDFEIPPFYRDSQEMRKQFARVYNSIQLTDKRIGELLDKLEKDGLKDSTIIFFFADHGEGIPRGKTNGINLGYRVPFIIWLPDIYSHLSSWGTGGVVTDELIDFTDLAPTILGLANIQCPEFFDGKDLLKADRNKKHLFLSSDRADNGLDLVRTVTDGKYVYSRNFMPFMPEVRYIRYMEIGEIKQIMRTDYRNNNLNQLQKSLFEPRPVEFLFDIENDIWETDNLAGNKQNASILKRMRQEMKKEILQSRDILFLPEYEIEKLQSFSNAYEFRLDEKKYPLIDIYKSAILSGTIGKKIAARQVELLKHSNPIVRYWAIVGLRSQNEIHLAEYQNVVVDAINDPYPLVQIYASAIAFDLWGVETGKEKLKELCVSNNASIALNATNCLQYIQNKLPFIETIKSARKMNNHSYAVKVAYMDFLGSLGLVPNDNEHRY